MQRSTLAFGPNLWFVCWSRLGEEKSCRRFFGCGRVFKKLRHLYALLDSEWAMAKFLLQLGSPRVSPAGQILWMQWPMPKQASLPSPSRRRQAYLKYVEMKKLSFLNRLQNFRPLLHRHLIYSRTKWWRDSYVTHIRLDIMRKIERLISSWSDALTFAEKFCFSTSSG